MAITEVTYMGCSECVETGDWGSKDNEVKTVKTGDGLVDRTEGDTITFLSGAQHSACL